MPRTVQPHAYRTGECVTCLDPLPAGHDRFCSTHLAGETVTCSTSTCRVRLPRRADGAAQTCDGCAAAVGFDLDVVPVARSARGKRPAA